MRQLYYRYLAFIYALTYRTNRRRFVGFAIGSWIKLLLLGLLFMVWIQQWDRMLMITLLVASWVYLAYWRSRRVGYVKFIANPTAPPASNGLAPLPANQRVPMWATGTFIIRDDDEYTLLTSAEYWQVPLGDHIVMVELARERFGYQFFTAADLLEVRPGCLLFGAVLRHTLAVTILETHQTIAPSQFNFANPDKLDMVLSKKRILYFTFTNEETLHGVWHNIIHDARRVRA